MAKPLRLIARRVVQVAYVRTHPRPSEHTRKNFQKESDTEAFVTAERQERARRIGVELLRIGGWLAAAVNHAARRQWLALAEIQLHRNACFQETARDSNLFLVRCGSREIPSGFVIRP